MKVYELEIIKTLFILSVLFLSMTPAGYGTDNYAQNELTKNKPKKRISRLN